MNFIGFPKLARLNREIVITEKIDGTNAQVYITTPFDRELTLTCDENALRDVIAFQGDLAIMAGSRTKWITPGKQTDNAGFAQWVKDHAEDLFQLGPGQHFGEWWGGKIQRGYGLTEKRFSLFNTGRWADRTMGQLTYIGDGQVGPTPIEGQQWAPVCCRVVPVLYQGPFSQDWVKKTLLDLRDYGSIAAPGFPKPEGVVIYHTAANTMFKVTIENDESPKSQVKEAA